MLFTTGCSSNKPTWKYLKTQTRYFQQWLQELRGTLLYIVRLQQVSLVSGILSTRTAVKNNCKPHKTEILPKLNKKHLSLQACVEMGLGQAHHMVNT